MAEDCLAENHVLRMSNMIGGIVMSEVEGYHMREEDVFSVQHSIDIASNDKIASDYVIYDAKCIPMQMHTNIISDISKIEIIMQKDTCLLSIQRHSKINK